MCVERVTEHQFSKMHSHATDKGARQQVLFSVFASRCIAVKVVLLVFTAANKIILQKKQLSKLQVNQSFLIVFFQFINKQKRGVDWKIDKILRTQNIS